MADGRGRGVEEERGGGKRENDETVKAPFTCSSGIRSP